MLSKIFLIYTIHKLNKRVKKAKYKNYYINNNKKRYKE